MYTFKTCPLALVDEWGNEYFCSWAPENDCTSGNRVILQHLKSGRWYYCTNFHLLWSSEVKEFQQSLESLYYWHETYHKISNISCTKSPNLIVPCPVLQLSLPNPVKPGVRREWRCSWSSGDRRCSNYIWVINFIAYKGVTYIRGLTVHIIGYGLPICLEFFRG